MRLKDLTPVEQVVLALSLVALGFLVLDPFMLERARSLPPGASDTFHALTHFDQASWMLIPVGVALALAILLQHNHTSLRGSTAYGLVASAVGFVFVSVGGAVLIATLLNNILGRARPKLYDMVGPFDFQVFAFQSDYASLPSGYATGTFAFAAAIGILWPRWRVLLYTLAAWLAAGRVFIGGYYFTDAVLGAALGTVFPYVVRNRFAARRWLFERTPKGGYRIRGPRTQAWLGLPEPVGTTSQG